MGIELFKHNAVAYDKIKEMFKIENRVAVVHPTGCGKSFISLKWLEENRDKRAIFLAPTISILEQIEKHIEDCGMSIKDFPNLKRYTYYKLSKMEEEDIKNLDVDIIVLDEFHRCGAIEWNQGIINLINNNKSAKVLGFSATPIRYLDEHRNMAEELFQGNIASEITLEEAMIEGILPIPTYINAVYSFKEDIESKQEKINREIRELERLQAQQYLDDAKKVLEKADGLPQIFQKHMKNKSGKYIVFCRNQEHMESMMEESKEWFKIVNEQVDRYSMASSYSKKENMDVLEKFYYSNNNHLKLLFSIDMLNEGIHVPDIDGVIMLRPTVSPIIFKQQLGRALSVGHNRNPVIFDIVNNVQSCEMVSNFIKDLKERALVKFTQTGSQEDKAIIDAFQISDTIRTMQDIFNKIDNCLSLSWENYYELAVEYYNEHGNLKVPINYSKNGLNLGIWISHKRKAYKGTKGEKSLNEEQIRKLESIGMIWDVFKEQWDETYEIAKEYYEEHGNLDGLYNKRVKGKNLYLWLDEQIQLYNKKILPEDKIQLLEQIGMTWNRLDTKWKKMFDVAKEYQKENGTFKGIKDKQLKAWINTQRKVYKRGNLSNEKIKLLEDIGMVWDELEKDFLDMYILAKKYYDEHGDLFITDKKYEMGGKNAYIWIQTLRKLYKKGTLPQERINLLEEIGMVWDLNEHKWKQVYKQAKEYYLINGNTTVSSTGDYSLLYNWIKNQKAGYYGKNTCKLTEEQVRQLQEIGILPSGDNIELKNNINSREEYLQYQISLLKTLREVLIKCKGDGLTDSDIIYNRENVETGPVKYLHKNKPSKQ